MRYTLARFTTLFQSYLSPIQTWTYDPLVITIPAGSVTEPLDNFPVMIKLDHDSGASGADLRGILAVLGSDANRKRIAVATADGTLCPVEIAEWSTADMRAVLWVKVPRIEPNQDTKLYLYYDPAHAEMTDYVGDTGEPAAQRVWGNGYAGVWLMKPNGGQVLDSTGNGNHGMIYGATATQGPLGTALAFDGVDDYVDCGNSVTLDPGANDFTLEVMAKAISGATRSPIVSKGGWYHVGYSIQMDNAGADYYFVARPSGSSYKSVRLGLGPSWDWKYIGGSRSGNTLSAVVDGIAKGNAVLPPDASLTSSQPLQIGRYVYQGVSFFNGEVGFVALSSVARSPAWIAATNAVLHDTFVTYSYTTGVTHELAGTVEAAAVAEGATARLRSVGGRITTSATVNTPMLTRLRGISGAPGAVSISNGYLQALLDLYGAAISVQVGLSGVITRLRSLTGSALGKGVLSGVLKATNLISGAIPCKASISGLLKATLPVTAPTVSATPSCSGRVQVVANLYGAIPANATTLESLLRATTPLTGTTLPAQASLSGGLQVEARLTGTLPAQATTQIEAWVRIRGNSATVPGNATVGGALKAPTPIEGSLLASASTSASVTRVRTLIGAIAATSGTNGSVAAPVSLSGTVAPSPGVSGALQATFPVAGTVAVNSGASVTVTRLRSVVGGVAADSGCTGVCVAYVALGATVAAVGEGSASLAAPVSLQALVPVSSGSATSVTRIRSLSVSVPAVSGGTGTFFTQVDIVGIVPGTASVAGTLQAEVVLEVSLAAVTGATSTVIRLRRVEGRVETIGAATGHLEAINQITGTIHAVSSGIGNLHAPVPLTGEIHEVSGAAGIVYSGRVAVLVPGTSVGTSITATSPITRLRSCSGVTRGSSAVNGDLAPAVPLFADLVASSDTLADLTVGQEILFSGDTSATSLLSASLNAVISLNGALNTEGKITGLIAYIASLTGSVLEASGATGGLAGPKPLYGAINSGSSINGEICAVYSVNGTISCESSVSGNLTAIVPLNTECTVTGGLNGVLAVPQVEHLTGAFSATGSCAGSISVTVRLETAIVSISEILGDLKSGVAFSSEVTPVSSVTGELRLIKAVELSGSISAVSINSGITNTRRSLTCEGAVATTTVSVWLSRAIPITCVVSEASWVQANIDLSASLSGTIAAYSGIQGSLGVRSIRAATSYMEVCVASTTREATCVRETAGYAVPITAKVSYAFSFTVISSTRKIVAKTVYRVVSSRYREEYRVFALPDDINVTVAIPEFRVVGLKEDVLVTVVDY